MPGLSPWPAPSTTIRRPCRSAPATTGGGLSGAGSLNENAILSWQNGTIALGGGTTIGSSGELLASGPNPKALAGTLTNESAFSQLDGSGTLTVGVPGMGSGSLVNATGTLEMSLPSIAGDPASSLINSPLGTIKATASPSAPTVIAPHSPTRATWTWTAVPPSR